MNRRLIAVVKPIAVLLLALVAVQPRLRTTLPWSDDGLLHFWRVVELDHCLRHGYLYPRWMPDMAYGYGFPLLNYYAPLSVYLAEGFHLLGLSFTAALLAALSAGLALGALGAYLWARDAFGEAGGLIAAVAYTYAPYTLYDAIWRGNLAESLARQEAMTELLDAVSTARTDLNPVFDTLARQADRLCGGTGVLVA